MDMFKPIVINLQWGEPAAPELTKADTPPKTFDVPPNAVWYFNQPVGGKRKPDASVDFPTLRGFSVVYDVARACINFRKGQIKNLDWNIVPRDEKKKPEAFAREIEALEKFFAEPYRGVDFPTFIGRILEDLLVLDAIVLWKDRTYGGELKELIPVDAATIRIMIAEDGSLPEPPNPAYMQVIQGEVYGKYSTEEMIYKLMHARTTTPYGLSPLESLILGVDAAIRSQLANLSLLSEGNMPEGFYALPETWTPEQIKEFQTHFDLMVAGNPRFQSRLKFMPGGKGVGFTATKKAEEMRFLEYEKWLLLKTCALYDVQPSDIGYIEHVNRSEGANQREVGSERGLIPTARFLKQMFDQIIRNDFGLTDVVFQWQGLGQIDERLEIDKNDKLLSRGVITIDEIRVENGREPFNLPATQRPFVVATGGPILVEDIGKEVDEPDEADLDAKDKLEEMVKMQRKALKYHRDGKPFRFTPEYLDEAAAEQLTKAVNAAQTPEEIRTIFKGAIGTLPRRIPRRETRTT